MPILLSREIAEPDGPQVRVKILGEKLLAFRDTEGKVGLIDEFCSHRGASLYFGRNEENGIRCSYHGLKFTRQGECVDVPSAPQACKAYGDQGLSLHRARRHRVGLYGSEGEATGAPRSRVVHPAG